MSSAATPSSNFDSSSSSASHDENEEFGIETVLKLPLDIFLDILSRLPLAPLAISRCVCKNWRKIIHHPRFRSLHEAKVVQLQNTLDCDGGDGGSTGLVLHRALTAKQLYVLEHDDSGDGCRNVAVAQPRFYPSEFHFNVVGSCNGLICLCEPEYEDPICVCNPVTGEYLMLPDSQRKRIGVISGFAYDHVSKKYKVIRLSFDSVHRESQWHGSVVMEAEIYTLGSGGWRKLEDVPYLLRRERRRPFVSGALHWMTEDCVGSSASQCILAFDVSTEKFGTVPLPSELSEFSKYDLGELRKCLCVFDYTSNDRFEIWVMKDYGVKSSWTKEYIIPRQELGLHKLYIYPLKVLRNGEILLVYDNEALLCYDPKHRSVRKLGIHGLPHRFEVITHVGSFVSLRNIVGLTASSSIIKRRWYRTMYPIPSHNPELNMEDWILDHEVQQFAALLDSDVPFYDIEHDW